jgi:lipoprotein-releasing system permease protein
VEDVTDRVGFWSSARLGRKVGFRYLRSKKSSSFLSLITVISFLGVAVGVMTMVVTLSVMSGFETELKGRLFDAETHVLLEPRDGYLDSTKPWGQLIREASTRVNDVFPVLQTEVILRAGQKVGGAVFKGLGTEQMDWLQQRVTEWAPEEFKKRSSSAKIFIGQEMAFNLAAVAGDEVTLVSPVEADGPFGAVPRVKKFFVEGIYKTGVPEQELHVVFGAHGDVESFLRSSGVLSQVEVRVKSFDDAESVAAAIRKTVDSSVEVRSWQELNAHLFRSLKLERAAMFCILIFIVIVASFNIVSTLTMMVVEKKRSLSILRAIGATPRQVASIFLWEGLTIGLVGTAVGAAVGLLICHLLRRYPIIELPDVFYDRSLPVVIDPVSLMAITMSALFVVLLASLVPAFRASRLVPIQGIRER